MKKAFTIIELIVTIVIIVLLISMILPSLYSARQLAKGKTCLNNLKNIQLSITMYAADYKDLPDAFLVETEVSSSNLSSKIESYICSPPPKPKEKKGVWACPFDPDPWETVGGSYLYTPFILRQNYSIPPFQIYENCPLVEVMRDQRPRTDGKCHYVRYDASAFEEKQQDYMTGATWLQTYRKQ